MKKRLILFLLILFSTYGQTDLDIYGYFSSRFEKTYNEPSLNNGSITEESAPAEIGLEGFNLMMQQSLNKKFRMYLNFNGADDVLELVNYFGEYSHSQLINIRVGKIYRRFGLYNEMLDAVPTYFGIEPPEIFDGDHLMISRTTNVMIHGEMNIGSNILSYAFTTDNGEGGANEDLIPIGFDLNYAIGLDAKIGISGYFSNGKNTPDKGVGEGSPSSGVLPWMSEDDFSVFGGYVEGSIAGFTIQFEYWNSPHDVTRDASAVVRMINGAGNLFDTQLERFLIDPNGAVTENNIVTTTSFDVENWYIRAGYPIAKDTYEVIPYFQWDWYSNPETIKSKTYGGDNEAGASEDGVFSKSTVGIVYKPITEVALKIDQSYHFYKLNGENVNYPEIRISLSYTYGL